MTTTYPPAKKSTTVRAKNAAPPAVRLAFRTLDRIAPALSARWALRLWCTTPANAGRRRDERPRPGERSLVALSGGREVTVETWGFGPPVYLVHGWGGWRGQLGQFVTPLVESGLRVVAFDAPSHGESAPGRLGPGRATAPEFVEALTAVTAAHGTPAGIVAHSLGCATTALAIHDGLAAGRLALIAPSADPIALTDGLARMLGYGPRTSSRFLTRLESLAERPLGDFDAAPLGADGSMPPTMVIHDRDDKEVPYDDGVRLASAWPSAELVTTEGLGHQRILRDAGIVSLVVDFVAGGVA